MGTVDPKDLIEEAQRELGCPKCGQTVCTCEANPELEKQQNEEMKEEPVPAAAAAFGRPAKSILKTLPNAPSDEQIALWKERYGGVIYILPLSDKDLYVWRYLNRQEWQQIVANEDYQQNEMKMQEAIVRRAVLWPAFTPEFVALSRAGTIPTLFNVIMQGCHFYDTMSALNMVEEL